MYIEYVYIVECRSLHLQFHHQTVFDTVDDVREVHVSCPLTFFPKRKYEINLELRKYDILEVPKNDKKV